MRRALIAALLALLAVPAAAEEIGSVGYRFKWLGPNDKIVVEAFDDPDVPGVTWSPASGTQGARR
jgi:CreA protein